MPEDQIIVQEQVTLIEIVNQDFPVTAQEDVTIVEVTEETVAIISVADQGPSGPPGPQGTGIQGEKGDQGEVGPAGPGDKTYTHIQNTPDTTWSVNHNLGKRPTVTLVDSADTQIEGEFHYVDENNLVVALAIAVSGKVYCN